MSEVVGLNVSLADFLEAAAARRPTPGGGAVAALTGALGASMLEMVLNYSLGKKGLEPFEGEIRSARQQAGNARRVFQQLVEEDQTAYAFLSSLRKLGPDDPERVNQWPGAVVACIRVPQTIAATGLALLELCDHVVHFVNPHLLSDLAVAADLAMASTRCGVYNVRVNLPELPDAAARREVESAMFSLLQRGPVLVRRVTERVWERINLAGS